MYAEVVPLGLPLSSSFHYSIPAEVDGRLGAGHLVKVSFGAQRVQGVVVALSDEPPQGVAEFKSIESLVDEQPVLTRAQLDLAYYLAHHTLAPLADCLMLMLPPGLAKMGDLEYELADVAVDAETDLQFRLLQLLEQRGPMRARQIDRALPKRNWKPAADRLCRLGAIQKRPVLQPPSVRPKRVRTVRLLIPPEEVSRAALRLGHGPRYADILEHLFGLWPGQPALPDLLAAMECSGADVQALSERGWIEIIPPEPVVSPVYPPEVMRKWAAQHEADRPQAAAIVHALSQAESARAAPLASLPDAPRDVVEWLDQQDMVRYSINPARVRLKLNGAQLARQAKALRRPSRRAAVLKYLAQVNRPTAVSWVYAETGASPATLKDLAERGLVDLAEQEIIRDPLADEVFLPDKPPTLTRDQAAAWSAMEAAFALTDAPTAPPPFLLHGVTGSGKTEIYLRAVEETLKRGRQAIMLVPEIALTPQTVRRFAARFPERIAVIHSGLTDGERYDTWRRARAGAVEVVIGARSALFAPLPDIGLIVVDEEHDEAYQQDSFIALPHYSARAAAVEYARRLGAICVLGSATPDVVSYSRAKRGDYRLLELPQRIMAHREAVAMQAKRLNLSPRYRQLSADAPEAQYIDLPEVAVVDMRQELRAGNRSLFSRALSEGLAAAAARGEQAILFLNRRGASTFVFCRDCGHTLACPRCEMPFTFHSTPPELVCHHCGHRRRQPSACPQCKSARVKYFGAGTEKVEAEVRRLFPQLRTLRWDRDTTQAKGAHDLILRQFGERRADVLIGTQMVAKGLDLPLVTLVGVVSADVGLGLPDYRAAERVFQVLTQVAGRAGRSLLGGRVIVQTYQPEHYAIQAASGHDYLRFYERELNYRREHGYPPFGRLISLTYHHHRADRAETEAHRLGDLIRNQLHRAGAHSTSMIGPAPCYYARVGSEYRWQIVLRGPHPAALLAGLPLKEWRVEVDPMSLL